MAIELAPVPLRLNMEQQLHTRHYTLYCLAVTYAAQWELKGLTYWGSQRCQYKYQIVQWAFVGQFQAIYVQKSYTVIERKKTKWFPPDMIECT